MAEARPLRRLSWRVVGSSGKGSRPWGATTSTSSARTCCKRSRATPMTPSSSLSGPWDHPDGSRWSFTAAEIEIDCEFDRRPLDSLHTRVHWVMPEDAASARAAGVQFYCSDDVILTRGLPHVGYVYPPTSSSGSTTGAGPRTSGSRTSWGLWR